MSKPEITRRWILGAAAALPLGRAAAQSARPSGGFVDSLRPPDLVTAFLENDTAPLTRGGLRWTGKGVTVEAEPRGAEIPIRIEAEEAPLMRVRLRWRARVPLGWRVLNEQWERSYGELTTTGLLFTKALTCSSTIANRLRLGMTSGGGVLSNSRCSVKLSSSRLKLLVSFIVYFTYFNARN